eukprot:Gb_14822 [translate_table: standard]
MLSSMSRSVVIRWTILLVLTMRSDANCDFFSVWKSIANVSNAVQQRDGGKLIPTRACSQDQGYCLTFFNNFPNLYYLSMVAFDNHSSIIDFSRVIWTANRNNPVPENSTVEFREDGNLVLQTPDGLTVWSTDKSGLGVVRLSVCGGNLKLLDATNNSVWESFNNPTDTLIPAQILQVGMRLVSSKSATDFSEGTYSLVAKNCGVVLYDNLTTSSAALPYWIWALDGPNDTAAVDSSKCGFNGLVMGSASFSLMSASLQTAPVIIGSQYENPASPGISFQNSGMDPTPYTYLRLDSDGVLRGSSFSSGWSYVFQLDQYLEDPCSMPNSCNSYGVCTSLQGQSAQCSCPDSNSFVPNSTTTPNAGCTRRVPLESDCTGKEDMMMLSGIDYFPNQYMKSLNLSEEAACRDECLRNCSCLAAFYWNNSGSCFHIADSVRSLKNTGDRTRTAYLKIQLDRHSGSKIPYKGLGIGLGSAVAALLLILLGIRHRLRNKRSADLTTTEVEEEFKDYRGPKGLFKRFNLKELQRATEGFGQKIGEGGFGTVYLGTIEGNKKIAVKRVECSRQGKKGFRAEIESLGNIQHVNLVHLLGFCAEGNELLLVYEYVVNGSLDRWIFRGRNGSCNAPLEWEQRWKIANGVAHGLAYLHEQCRNAEQSRLETTLRGTPGYLAPEWLLENGISSKSDVYSLGMVLLELVSGRKNVEVSVEEERRHYPSWAWRKIQEKGWSSVKELVDPCLHRDYEEEEVEIMLNLAFKCVQRESSSRPSMGEVVQILEKKMEGGVLMNPVFAFDIEEQEVTTVEKNRFSGCAWSSVVDQGR